MPEHDSLPAEECHAPYVVGGGVVTDGVDVLLEDGAIEIRGGKIEAVGPTAKVRNEASRFYDVGGRLILPGMLNAHHHLYSFLATGLSPRGSTESFADQLRNFWWHLDSVLDEESVYWSALMGLIDSIHRGVTMLFDHHASMAYVHGSLGAIERAMVKAGVRGLLCFETSDRRGTRAVGEHIAENVCFWQDHRDDPMIKGSFGLHANFTLSEATLEAVRAEKPRDMPIHIHCGEDRVDIDYCHDLGYEGPVQRLAHFGLLSGKSILAHVIHLSRRDYALIEQIEPVLVANAESNANNQVGSPKRENLPPVVLGTDGMSGDMVASLRSLYLLGRGRRESLRDLNRIFFARRYAVQRAFFPECAALTPGSPADVAVLDYAPLTPVTHDNIVGHLLFGARTGRACMTICDGRILLEEGRITFADEAQLRAKAKEAASRLHERYYG